MCGRAARKKQGFKRQNAKAEILDLLAVKTGKSVKVKIQGYTLTVRCLPVQRSHFRPQDSSSVVVPCDTNTLFIFFYFIFSEISLSRCICYVNILLKWPQQTWFLSKAALGRLWSTSVKVKVNQKQRPLALGNEPWLRGLISKNCVNSIKPMCGQALDFHQGYQEEKSTKCRCEMFLSACLSPTFCVWQ